MSKGGAVWIARESRQILVTAIFTSNPGKAVFQNAAVQIAVNDLFDVGAKETVLSFEPPVIDRLEGFKMVLHALVIGRVLGIALSVYGFRHESSHLLPLETKPNAGAKDVPY